jgi:hypothetical protein
MKQQAPQIDEFERLARRCKQHEYALQRLSDALLILRAGNDALREENRELRVELQRHDRRREQHRSAAA